MKSDKLQNENISKGNSEDSLLVIYILDILKKYSSPENPLSSQDVMEYLRNDYSIGKEDNSDALKKKIRRHLDTLHESYLNSCIRKEEGKTRKAHKWYYDVSKDNSANEEGVVHETLSEAEVEFLVDLVSATKILNSEGTRGMIDKLLKKTSISEDERARRLGAIQKEAWLKTPNSDLVEKKDFIEECFYSECLTFDYEDEENITAIPLGWIYEDGVCFLNAKVGEEYRNFSLDKIRSYNSGVDGYEDVDDFRRYDEESDSDKTTLDSLFANIPTIKKAIAEKKRLNFFYRSYVVDNDRVISDDKEMSVLPHSLVFNDGKYYLIGIDEKTSALNKIGYFRADLMFELYCIEAEIKLSDWDKHIFETIERAREVEKHPLMLAGKDIAVTFKVAESALDRVIDAFAVKSDKLEVAEETRLIKDSSGEDYHEERLVNVKVRTTREEAFRWALANADAVELVYPQDIRHRLRRIAPAVHRTYAKTMDDKVQANIDRVLATGIFEVNHNKSEGLSYQTFKALYDDGNNVAVNEIKIHDVNADEMNYAGTFVNTKWLYITKSQCMEPRWVSDLKALVNIQIFMTSIADVSWLADLNELRVVRLMDSPISDLTVLKEHEKIIHLELCKLPIGDISFVENLPRLLNLKISGCPIEDYTPLLRIQPLDYLEIDEKVVKALGMDNLIKHHPDAVINVQQKINNRKV